MATLRFSVLSTRQTSKKTFLIYLTITHKREVRYISTGYEVDDLYQFDKGKVVCRKDAQVMNQRLGYVLSEYREKLDAIDNLDIYTCSQIKEILEGRHKVVPYIGTWIETFEGLEDSSKPSVIPYIGTWIKTSKTYLQSTQFIKLSISLFYHARQNCSTLLLYTLLHNRHDVTYYLSETISKNESK